MPSNPIPVPISLPAVPLAPCARTLRAAPILIQ